MRTSVVGFAVITIALGGGTACATKGFVRTEVGKVGGKVDALSQSLEQTEERTRQTEEAAKAADNKAQGAQATADQAREAAGAADAKAGTAGDSARIAAEHADALDKASKRLMYTVMLTEDEAGFAFNKVDLPDAAKAKIDEMIEGIKADPKGAYFEIEGYTDNVGPKDVNDRIGLARAEAVKRYLYEQHQVPLHRINIISYGEDNPVAPNTTKDGRSQNRRIVIKVLI